MIKINQKNAAFFVLYLSPLVLLYRGAYFGALAMWGLFLLPYIKVKKLSIQIEDQQTKDENGSLARALNFWQRFTINISKNNTLQ